MIITIDGPAASGKSTVARELANRLGFHFLNTGAMYRAVALGCVIADIDLDDDIAVADVAQSARITFPGGRPHLDGRDVTSELRTEPVSLTASRIALNPEVRNRLVAIQREAAAGQNVVTEGRDQGTIVFPNADFKLFLTASAETRAARRLAELAAIEGEPPHDVTFQTVLAQIRDRDERDANRPIAPLRPAPEAVVFDTSQRSIDEAVEEIEHMFAERFPREI